MNTRRRAVYHEGGSVTLVDVLEDLSTDSVESYRLRAVRPLRPSRIAPVIEHDEWTPWKLLGFGYNGMWTLESLEEYAARYDHSRCVSCGGAMVGDGFTRTSHCEFVDLPSDVEKDVGPIYCELEQLEDA